VPARAEPIEAHPAPAAAWTPPESGVPTPRRPCRARQACTVFLTRVPRPSPPPRLRRNAPRRRTQTPLPPPDLRRTEMPPALTASAGRFRRSPIPVSTSSNSPRPPLSILRRSRAPGHPIHRRHQPPWPRAFQDTGGRRCVIFAD
jgi:hypothetical protein